MNTYIKDKDSNKENADMLQKFETDEDKMVSHNPTCLEDTYSLWVISPFTLNQITIYGYTISFLISLRVIMDFLAVDCDS